MSSQKQTVWTYRPLSDRRSHRRSLGPGRSGDTSTASVDLPLDRSSQRPLRSASLVCNGDLLSSRIRDFLQRTDQTSGDRRRRSQSRSVDTAERNTDIFFREPYFRSSDLTISSRDNSIWEKDETSEAETGRDEACSVSSANDNLSVLEDDALSIQSFASERSRFDEIKKIGSKILYSRRKCSGEDIGGETVDKCVYEKLKQHFYHHKSKMTQQHQLEMDQLFLLKKQLERKLYNSLELVDEQKQLACQWRNKFTKLSSDFSQLKLQLDDQYSEKSLLEKKKRKGESDCQFLLDELSQEKKRNDRLERERDLLTQENSNLEETIQELKKELQTRGSQIETLHEELSNSSRSNLSDVELEHLKMANGKLKKKCVDLEEELEKSSEQVTMLEESKYKMEQRAEQLRKEHKQELAQREEESYEAQLSLQKKIKSLQCQLEQEHYDRTALMREKYNLERRMEDLQESISQSENTSSLQMDKMKTKLIKTKALLRDEKNKDQTKCYEANKLLVRKLKKQLDGAELEKLTAIKSKQKFEMEYADLTNNMADLEKCKGETERKLVQTMKQVDSMQHQLDDKDEELSQVMSKYGETAQQLTDLQSVIREMSDQVTGLEEVNASLHEKVANLNVKMVNQDSLATSSSKLQAENYKAKMKELEFKIELDKTVISRKHSQIANLHSQIEKLALDKDVSDRKEMEKSREIKSYTRQIRELQEETRKLSQRETDLLTRNKDLALRIETVETEKGALNSDLKLVNQRLEDLKKALEEETESQFSDSSTETLDDTTISLTTTEDFRFHSEPSLYEFP